jgi:hypothetical protein
VKFFQSNIYSDHTDRLGLKKMLSEEGIVSVGAKSREPGEAGNGRVYDPVVGRFLSPDPVIQSPDFTQNYNGYSYCLNNPLKYIDPSGYNLKTLWQKIKNFFSGNKDNQSASYGPTAPNDDIDPNTELPWLPVTGGTGIGYIANKSSDGCSESISSQEYLIPFINHAWTGMPFQIHVNRLVETSNGTISEFNAIGPIPYVPIKGYVLEPEGPSTTLKDQNQRIPAGVYWVTPHSTVDKPDTYLITNLLVSWQRGILFHIGNFRDETTGCELVGKFFQPVGDTYRLFESTYEMNLLRGLLTNNTAILTITEIYY